MAKHIFEDFLSSEEKYDAVVGLWRSIIDEAAERVGQSHEWRPWRPTAYVDGSPIPRDGGLIVDARSDAIERAITVMQHPPQSSDVEIAAWVAVRDWDGPEGVTRTDDLNLDLALSDESLAIAKILIEKWMDPGISRERMEDIISDSVEGT